MKTKTNLFRSVCVILVVMVMSLSLFSCSASYDKNTIQDSDRVFNIEGDGSLGYEDSKDGIIAETSNEIVFDERKIIFSASLDIETLDYEKSISDFENLISEYKGFIQESHIESNLGINNSKGMRRAEYTVRIPSEKLNSFRDSVGSIGTIIVNTATGDDVTDRYMDSEARLKTLQIQETRLLELLKDAKTLKDTLDIEDRLSIVRYEIEQFTGTLKKWDALISMSTVSVTLREVKSLSEPEPESFIDKIVSTFKNSITTLVSTLKQIVYIITAIFPFLIVFGGIILAAILITLKKKKSKKIKKSIEEKEKSE